MSLCRVPHDTAWVLCGVSTAALQTQAVPRTQPAYTHLALKSMSELLASRHRRSAWEFALPSGHHTIRKPPHLRLTRVSSVESCEFLSDSCPPIGAAAPLGTLLGGSTRNLLSARFNTLKNVQVVLERLGYDADQTYFSSKLARPKYAEVWHEPGSSARPA